MQAYYIKCPVVPIETYIGLQRLLYIVKGGHLGNAAAHQCVKKRTESDCKV